MSTERAETPAVGVMTSAFVSGAQLMASALGAAEYGFAVINHPIASEPTTNSQPKQERRSTKHARCYRPESSTCLRSVRS